MSTASGSSQPSVLPTPSSSATKPALILDCTDTVLGVKATAGNNAVDLSWDDPEGVEPTAYYVQVVPEARLIKVTAPVSGVSVSGLRNGVEYTFVVYAATDGGVSAPAEPVKATPTNGVEGEVAGLIVAFEPGVRVVDDQADVPGEQAVTQVDLTIDNQIADRMHVVELSEPVSLSDAKEISEELTADPNVAWAEPDQFVFTSAIDQPATSAGGTLPTPSDEQYATAQWNLWDAYGVGLGDGKLAMSRFYAVDAGAGARVAVIDTGITAHPDLDSQVVPGYDFVSDPPGLAAPRTEGGPDVPFDADEQSGWDANPSDPGDWRGVAPTRSSSWHGTHIAGLIAAATNNTEGITGIVPGARIQPIRALSWRGGLMSDIAASISWASGGHVDGVPDNAAPVDVINMSFAVQASCSVALQKAIDGAVQRGTVLVAAAGNANDDVAKYAPANCQNVIAVGATGRDGLRAPYSNYGSGIDVSAPGGSGTGEGGVVSTLNLGTQTATTAGYGAKEGTSIAAAHVAAAAAYLAATDVTASPADITRKLIGRSSVRSFAQATCDSDPAKTCGEGIIDLAQIAATGEPGVGMNLTVSDALIADGSTVAAGSVVGIGTSGLLSPGSGSRELRTSLHAGTVYRSGTALAPEGWTVNYSTNNGTSWVASEPSPASGVTDVKATKTVAAGLIEGTSQVYSSETSASIPSSNFSASTGGDGWDVFFSEENVYNIFHHSDQIVLDCHLRSTGDRCVGYTKAFPGYRASMRSGGWVDSTTGKMYAFTASTSTGRAGVLCINVSSNTSAPTSCGFTPLTSTLSTNNYNYLTEAEFVGRRIFGVATDGSAGQLLCFDAGLGTQCPNTPIDLVGTGYDRDSTANVRPIKVGNYIMVKTSTRIYCYVAATMDECSDQANWPVTINSPTKTPVAPHTDSSGTVDGICYQDGCFDLQGNARPTWETPFSIGGTESNNWAMHAVVGTLSGTRYFWAGEPLKAYCYDYATGESCTGNYPKYFDGYNLLYSVRNDPENPQCMWVNSDAGRISVFDAQTGNNGCSNNPVITLQPSQFAPRYACSTSAGISEWTTLRLVSIAGGGSASTVKLTVRDATGAAVSGWSDVPVTLGADLDMTGLSPAVSGSRPTFSFAFSGVSGTITTAVIALDYKGKGPELCVDTTATSANPPLNVTVTGRLTESVGAQEQFMATRSFVIGASNALITQTVPSAPRNLAASGLNTTATLTFDTPSSDGNSEVTGYQISYNNGSTWSDVTVTTNSDGSLSTRLTGLTVDTSYSVKVAAVNALGRGASASVSFTTQKVTMSTLADTPVNLGPVTLAATSSAGRSITYTSNTTSVCTVSGNVVTLKIVGTCELTAFTEGDPTASPVILDATETGSFEVLPAYVVATVPDEPTNLVASPASTQVSLSWTAPTDDGGEAITDYVIQYKSGSTWITYVDGVSTSTSTIVPGLTNGTLYSFRVAAKNAKGTGAYTASVSATPATVPGAPTSLAASGTGTSRSLTWTAPSSNGGSAITDYTVAYKLSSDATWTTFSDGTSASTGATVTGLTSGASYDFRVAAVNIVGASAFTSTVNLTATAGNEQVSLSWSQPVFTGGEVFDHYRVEYRASGTSDWQVAADPVSTTSNTVSGLSNGSSYDFRVATITTSSTSSYTSVATATPRTYASAPSDIAPIPGNRQIELTWSAPNNGGSAITDYVIQFKASTDASWTTVVDPVSTTTGVVVTGLPNGTLFDFRVATVNGVGTGSYSATINATPRTIPGTPTSLGATAHNGGVMLSWTAPSNNGGAAITDYVVEYRLSSAFDWSTYADGLSSAASATVSGLTNGQQYDFRVSAVNPAGAGSPSSVVATKPYTVPGAPTSLEASGTGTSRSLTWVAPTSNGGAAITDYAVSYKLSSAATWTIFADGVSSSTGATVTGLTSGESYDFKVAAVNAAGEGLATSTVNVTATPGAGKVTLTWATPTFTGGETVARYEVLKRLSSESSFTTYDNAVSASATSIEVTGLTNGTSYDFQIVTVTSNTTSSYSSVVTATPITTPDTPQNVVLTAGNGQIDVVWDAPSTTGGSAITDYRIQYRADTSPASSWTTLVDGVSTTRSARIPGLSNGTTYEVQVAAINGNGVGGYSTPATATPKTVPSAPQSPSASAGNGDVTFSWSAPSSTGGSAILSYVVEYKTSASATWTTLSPGPGVSTSATIGSLTNGTLYQFRVSATNAAGTGAESTVVSASPKTTPGLPTGLAATIGDGSVSLSWSAPSDDGGSSVTDYVIEMKLSTDSSWTTVNDGVRTLPSATISSLTNSSSYDFRVAAKNDVGSGSFTSSVSATPLARPSVPQSLTATYGNGSTALSWSAPSSDGGSAVTDYVIEYRAASAGSWTTASDGVNTNRSYTVTGLTNGTMYYFRVAAKNIAGTGSMTSAETATPRTVPSAPTSLAASLANATSVITWTAPSNNGGAAITDYVIEYKLSTAVDWTTVNDGTGTGTSVTLTGLTNGSTYNVRVKAMNSEGASSYATTSAYPRTVPDAPAAPTVTAADASLSVSWTAPYNGGSAITGYTVQYKLASAGDWTTLSPGNVTSTTISSLTNGSAYEVKVLATNAAGNSSYSSVTTATPRTVPGAPTSLAAVHGNTTVSLTWVAPANNGGAAVTDYLIEYKVSADATWSTFADGTSASTSATVTGLVNGTTYNFRVSAVNPAGAGAASSTVSDKPRTTPSEPRNLVVTADEAALDLAWDAPSYNGGQAIQDYVIAYRVVGSSSWTIWSDSITTTTGGRITGLTNGTDYEILVEAHNGVEADHTSLTVGVEGDDVVGSGTPRTVPDEPLLLTVREGDSQVTLSWSAPLFNGGSAITDYEVKYRLAGAATWTTFVHTASPTTSIIVTGLSNGSTYEFKVAGVNEAGSGTFTAVKSGAPVAPPVPTVLQQPFPVQIPVIEPPLIEPSRGGVILIDGIPANVNIEPSGDSAGWLVQAPDFSLRFRPQASNRPNIELGPQRQMMVPVGGWIMINGDGYQGSTQLSAYMIRRTATPRSLTLADRLQAREGTAVESRYVGEAQVRADGSFTFKLEVDPSMNPADYVLQVNGRSPVGALRSVNMAVTVIDAAAVAPKAGLVQRAAFFAPRSAKLSADGRRKLNVLARSVPVGASGVHIEVRAVSVSMPSIQENLELARKRGQRILTALQARGVKGTYSIAVSTRGEIRARSRFMAEELRNIKPLTRVEVLYQSQG